MVSRSAILLATRSLSAGVRRRLELDSDRDGSFRTFRPRLWADRLLSSILLAPGIQD